MSKKTAIIGGGAAGLSAACAIKSTHTVIYERNERVGKKLLVTGNGRCNLLNTELSPSRFKSTDMNEMSEILGNNPTQEITAFFEKLGLLMRSESEGRVYPLCNQATAVLDVLRLRAAENGAEFRCGFCVKEIRRKGGGFEIISDTGVREYADRVVLACGGMASPKTGSDGLGYTLAKSFGHTVTPLSPALSALKSDTAFTAPLKGVRARVKITLDGTDRQESGEIQFTDYGISGIAAMQLSRHLTGKDSVTIDFAEEYSEDYIFSLLKNSRKKDRPMYELPLGILQRRVGEQIIKRALKIGLNAPSESATNADLKKLAGAIKGLKLPVYGTLSWDNAQVTSGGIPLSEINPDTMESRLAKGVYITGEMLDCDGECGGFNLSWAWITALRAANSINEVTADD
ncbi:MAG: aminoacetone oxidase family FAD-binding enzyme [Clostridia bacterium]|nr:aminoacetone oxidase family FAD-binding enzyme [Clostridia bacterium]